jgi:hypothetical protein
VVDVGDTVAFPFGALPVIKFVPVHAVVFVDVHVNVEVCPLVIDVGAATSVAVGDTTAICPVSSMPRPPCAHAAAVDRSTKIDANHTACLCIFTDISYTCRDAGRITMDVSSEE